MPISVRDARERKADLAFIEGSLRHYLEDLGGMNSGIFPVLQQVGLREADQVASWLAEPGAMLLAIADGQQPVGFALVLQRPMQARGADYRMTEFFIARDMRRRGFGRHAARLILDRFAGQWEIVQNQANDAAVAFWRRVIADYSGVAPRERVVNGEVRQTFRSGAAR